MEMWITFNLINTYIQANANSSISHFKAILGAQINFDIIVPTMQISTYFEQINFFNNA